MTFYNLKPPSARDEKFSLVFPSSFNFLVFVGWRGGILSGNDGGMAQKRRQGGTGTLVVVIVVYVLAVHRQRRRSSIHIIAITVQLL